MKRKIVWLNSGCQYLHHLKVYKEIFRNLTKVILFNYHSLWIIAFIYYYYFLFVDL